MKLSVMLICLCICISAVANAAYAVEGLSISGFPVAVQKVVKREFTGVRVGRALMTKGKKHPIKLWYFQDGDPVPEVVYYVDNVSITP